VPPSNIKYLEPSPYVSNLFRTVDLLIKVACLVTKANNIFNEKWADERSSEDNRTNSSPK